MPDINENGQTFKEWLKLVDRELMAGIGLTHDCLADWPSYDNWADGLTPREAAEVCAVEWNDFPADLWGAVWEAGR